MYQLIMIIHVIAAFSILGLVLVQQGKGATMGAGFGSGASQTVFGSRGSGSFLLKLTAIFVTIFFATSIILNHMATTATKQEQQLNLPVNDAVPSLPVTPNNIPALPIDQKQY